MVKPFQFARLPKIIFGNGKIDELPGIIKKYGHSIIMVTGKHSFTGSPYYESLLQSFNNKKIHVHRAIIPGEPSPGMIDEAVNKFKQESVNVIVSIGGGSVLDAGKAISAMMYRDESVSEYLEGVGNKEHNGAKLLFIAVPTTSGTGSEATKNAVISQIGREGFKRSLRHDNFVPDIAIIDPELTLNCPGDITAASGMDCFTQLTEAWLSDKSNEYTDALAMTGLKAVKSSLVRSFKNGQDIEARAGMSFAALTSGICLTNAGLGAVHGFAASIGGRYNIPHGVICGTLMASANEVNVRELRRKSDGAAGLRKYALIGELFLDEKGRSADYYIDGFVQYLHDLTVDLQLPGLKIFGLEESELKNICAKTELKNNPVELNQDNLMEIVSKQLF